MSTIEWARVGMVGAVAAVVALVGAGCCQQPNGSALVINVGEVPVTVTVPDRQVEPVALAKNDAKLVRAEPPGAVELVFTAEGDEAPLAMQVGLQDDDVVMVSPYGCVALVDYTPQYQEGGGEVRVIAAAGQIRVGRIPPADFRFVRPPDEVLPADAPPNSPVVRLTRVPCQLLPHPERLLAFVARLD